MAHCLSMQFVAAYRLRVDKDSFCLLFPVKMSFSYSTVSIQYGEVHPFGSKQWKNWLLLLCIWSCSLLHCFPIECFDFRIHFIVCARARAIFSSTLRSFDNETGDWWHFLQCSRVQLDSHKIARGIWTCSRSLGNDIVHWRCRCVDVVRRSPSNCAPFKTT